ncbi:MAG: hypothetical protein HYT30_02375 [Parcubacteria group bacterium]|nr:hypothetical protein [Parcubacteria group bacterium]
MHTAVVSGAFHHAWETFLKRPWFLIQCSLFLVIISAVSSGVVQSVSETGTAATALVINLIDFLVVQIFVALAFVTWSLKVSDAVESVRFADLWAPQFFWKYLGASLIISVIEIIGFTLLIIPGIIAAVLLLFAPFIVVSRGSAPLEAIKESYTIGKHHFFTILLLIIAVAAANIAGALLLGIGLVISIPISIVAVAHAFRALSAPIPAA